MRLIELKIKPVRRTQLFIKPTDEYIQKKKSEFLDEIKELLPTLYEEENYELISNHGSFTVKVRYPEIFITNSRGDRHTIKELYMFYTFKFFYDWKSRCFKLAEMVIKGYRGLISENENEANYIHSHISKSSQLYCLGTGFLAERTSVMYEALTVENIEYFLVAMDIGLAQESIEPEGTPYFNMRTLYTFNSSSVNKWYFKNNDVCTINALLQTHRYLDFLFEDLPLDIIDGNLDFLIINESLFKKYYENVSEHLTAFIKSDDFVSNNLLGRIATQKINEEYYMLNENSSHFNNTPNTAFKEFIFKDRFIKPKIEKNDGNDEQNNEKYYIPDPLLREWLWKLCSRSKLLKFYKEELEEDKYEIAG